MTDLIKINNNTFAKGELVLIREINNPPTLHLITRQPVESLDDLQDEVPLIFKSRYGYKEVTTNYRRIKTIGDYYPIIATNKREFTYYKNPITSTVLGDTLPTFPYEFMQLLEQQFNESNNITTNVLYRTDTSSNNWPKPHTIQNIVDVILEPTKITTPEQLAKEEYNKLTAMIPIPTSLWFEKEEEYISWFVRGYKAAKQI